MPRRLLLLALCFLSILALEEPPDQEKQVESEREKNSVFVPTSEWKPLPKDQAIPRGLHVRVNLETGKREAKLLGPGEGPGGGLTLRPRGEPAPQPPAGISHHQLKTILSKMKGDERAPSKEEIEKVKLKFRSYQELKEELRKMETEVKTDLEIMEELMSRYAGLGREDPRREGEELAILADLEALVHQVDNARQFVTTGLESVVIPSLNSTLSNVRAVGARLVGSAVQNNPPAQVAALAHGLLPILLRIIAFDQSPEVRSGGVYALSCLVRRFPAAQGKFLESGGLTVLLKLFKSDASFLLKLQMKGITVIYDLIMEKRDAEKAVEEDLRRMGEEEIEEKVRKEMEERRERLRQYNTMGLERRLAEAGWCRLLAATLLQDIQGQANHDNMEKLLKAMESVMDTCRGEFIVNDKLQAGLEEVRATYQALMREEGPAGYLAAVYHLAGNITADLSPDSVLRDEL